MTENRIAMIRATLRYSKQEDVIRKLAPLLSRRGLFLSTRSTRSKGSAVHFEFRLADNSVTYAGMGIVREAYPYTGDDSQKVGMLIALQKINRHFKEVVDAILGVDEEQVDTHQLIGEMDRGEGLDIFGDLDVDFGLDSLFAGIEKKTSKLVQQNNSGVYERPAVVSGLIELPSETDFLELAQISDDVFALDNDVAAIEFDDAPKFAQVEERPAARSGMVTGEFIQSEVLARAERAQRNLESGGFGGKSGQDSKTTQELDALALLEKAEAHAREELAVRHEAQSGLEHENDGFFGESLLDRDNAAFELGENVGPDGDDAGEMAVRPQLSQSRDLSNDFAETGGTLVGMIPSRVETELEAVLRESLQELEDAHGQAMSEIPAVAQSETNLLEEVAQVDEVHEHESSKHDIADEPTELFGDIVGAVFDGEGQAGEVDEAVAAVEDAGSAHNYDEPVKAVDVQEAVQESFAYGDAGVEASGVQDNDLEDDGLGFDDIVASEEESAAEAKNDAFIESVLRESQQAMQKVMRDSHQAIQSVVRESSKSHPRIPVSEEIIETTEGLFAEFRDDIFSSPDKAVREVSGLISASIAQKMRTKSSELSLSSSEYLALNPDSDDAPPKVEDISLDALATPEKVPLEEAFMERINLMEGMPSRKERKTFDEPEADMPSKKGGFLGRIFGK